MSPLEVVVIGGSVGGLAAAHALLRAGCSVTVFERSQRVAAAGAVSPTILATYCPLRPLAFSLRVLGTCQTIRA